MSSRTNKTEPAYVRSILINGSTRYMLSEFNTGGEVFNFTSGSWERGLNVSNTYVYVDTVLDRAFQAGFKEVIEVKAYASSGSDVWYAVKKHTEQAYGVTLGLDSDTGHYKWGVPNFHFTSEYNALTALDSILAQSATAIPETVVPIVKAKKVRPPSETRKLEKEIIETVKKKRLASIALAEENADPYLRKQHANDVKTHEQTLKTLKARFPKWVLTWER